ncbi:PHP domain-containing protein [candidate division KSB1 bacterium]|nr:PHP domain-containing protein [candidate division KSB1 bacterium]
MLNWFKADLHIHTVLSACAELSMGPKDIVEAALRADLNLIAITDHNSTENIAAVIGAARGTKLTVLPGMEVSTSDQIHLVCLFPDMKTAIDFQNFIYAHLQQGHYDEDLYGPQIVCDHRDHIVEKNCKLLMFGIRASVRLVAQETARLGGLIYPAHIDRHAYSIYRHHSSLPFDIHFDAVELSTHGDSAQMIKEHPELEKYSFVFASDAHDISDIGKSTTCFFMQEPSFHELKLAFAGKEGRRISLHPCDTEMLIGNKKS